MPTSKKQLWLLVGGNGSGKSTFYETRLKPLGLPFVNADLIAKTVQPTASEEFSYKAAIIAEKQRNKLLDSGMSFCFETVFSHPSKIDFLGLAKSKGYEIIIVWIHLPDAQLNIARVEHQVMSGGHNVPTDKVLSRIERLVPNVKAAIPLCDYVHYFDNSSLDNPFRKVFSICGGEVLAYVDPLPNYVEFVLGF